MNSNFLLIEYIHLLIIKNRRIKNEKDFRINLRVVLLGSCGLRRDVERLGTTIRSPYKGQVTILEEGSDVPEGAERVASIFIGDKGLTTKCNYDYVMADLMKSSKKSNFY